jgi:hypothetical protein
MAVCCCLFSVACSLVGDESRSCDMSEGQETLEAAGLGTEGLTVLEGCTEVFRGLREGELRTAVAEGDEASVNAALQAGAVDPTQASSSPFEARTAPNSFDVPTTPSDQQWQEGERLGHRDKVEYRGREWDRYVAWGREQGGEDRMVVVVLETGSM